MERLMKYEYDIRHVNHYYSEAKVIQEMVDKGYRLVAIAPYWGGNSLYFERIAQPEPPKS